MSQERSLFSDKNIDPKELKDVELLDILKIVSPGTAIRLALDNIQRAGLGALIVLDKDGLSEIMEGGFKVNCRFSPQRLVELSKMDGAIIVSKDLKKIISANVLLVPNLAITTKETGTRHKAAERTAKQLKTLTMAVSERQNKITLYYGEISYVLQDSSEVLERAGGTLQVLEKQKDVFSEMLLNLNVLEMTNSVMISDVCSVMQRAEIIKKISSMVKRYIVELGKEGVVVSMRLKKLSKNVNREEELIIKDYAKHKTNKAKSILESMNFDFLLETQNIARLLFENLSDDPISPRGYRMLDKTYLNEKEIKAIITNFGNLDNVINAGDDELTKLLKKQDRVENFKEEIRNLKEKIMMGKKI